MSNIRESRYRSPLKQQNNAAYTGELSIEALDREWQKMKHEGANMSIKSGACSGGEASDPECDVLEQTQVLRFN